MIDDVFFWAFVLSMLYLANQFRLELKAEKRWLESKYATPDPLAACINLELDGRHCVLQQDYQPRCPCADYKPKEKDSNEKG
jgi:hypothetical protein